LLIGNLQLLSKQVTLRLHVSIDNVARIAKGLHVEPWKLLKDD
jgi:hypothetical protein